MKITENLPEGIAEIRSVSETVGEQLEIVTASGCVVRIDCLGLDEFESRVTVRLREDDADDGYANVSFDPKLGFDVSIEPPISATYD